MSIVTPTVSNREAICKGMSTKIYVLGGNTYQWKPTLGLSNSTNSMVAVSPSVTTVYTVSVSNNSLCPSTATVEVTVNPLPVVNAGRDSTVNMDEVATLNGTGNVPVGFISNSATPLNCNFCPSVMVNPQDNTCYTLMGENEYGCIAFDKVCITVTKDWDIFIPNTFTPNGDEKNDLFMAFGYGILQIDMIIFDKWGTIIFNEKNTQNGWSGKKGGSVCEQGIYVYKIYIQTMNGKYIERIGHITVLPQK